MKKTEQVFFALLRAGLWEQKIELLPYGPVDFDAIYKLAEEQSVIGLVGAGMEHITDTKVEKMKARPFLTWVIAQEQRNSEMNRFIVWLMTRLSEEGVFAVLVKVQGVAQCYSRPNWRAAGDVDLLLDTSNYEKAKAVLIPLASSVEEEKKAYLHLGMTLGGFEVELHGSLRTTVLVKADKVIDEVQEIVVGKDDVRSWQVEDKTVLLPSADADAVLIFSHILQHFYKGGIGLRQVCDWSRLLWTYRDSIDRGLLRSRLDAMDIFDEWRGFAALAVDTLGMPSDAMPFYEDGSRWHRKGRRLLSYVLASGNFGHNKDRNYYQNRSYLAIKVISLWNWLKDYSRLMRIFPRNASLSLWKILKGGAAVAVRGE